MQKRGSYPLVVVNETDDEGRLVGTRAAGRDEGIERLIEQERFDCGEGAHLFRGGADAHASPAERISKRFVDKAKRLIRTDP